MSKPLPPPDVFKVYLLVKQTKMTLTPISSSLNPGSSALGYGFFWTREEAEQHRTMERLRSTDESIFLVYELEVPNTANA